MSVYITQLLCPLRHCILAAVWEEQGDATAKKAETELWDQFSKLGLNHWCGICGSQDLRCETALTRFKDLDHAKPILFALEAANLATGALLGEAHPEGKGKDS